MAIKIKEMDKKIESLKRKIEFLERKIDDNSKESEKIKKQIINLEYQIADKILKRRETIKEKYFKNEYFQNIRDNLLCY